MLPLVALLLFALFGIGALTVDGGLAFAEKARLETRAEMMAAEAEYASRGEASSTCRRSRNEAGCRRREALMPMLEDLGGLPWNSRDRSLDGTEVDSRGARLGDLAGVKNLLEPGNPFVLERRSPFLFGWAAIPAISADAPRPDLPTIQDARRRQGISPHVQFEDAELPGFRIVAHEEAEPRMSQALRVGPMFRRNPGLPPDSPSNEVIPGAVGIAILRAEAATLLTGGIVDLEQSGPDFVLPGEEEPVAFTFGMPAQGFLAVGSATDQIGDDRLSEIPATRAVDGYVAVVEEPGGPILAFASVALQLQAGQLRLGPASNGSHTVRNASAAPGSANRTAMIAALRRLAELESAPADWHERLALVPQPQRPVPR